MALHVVPHAKTFMWSCFHGRIMRFQFFYNLNVSPQMMCSFSGLVEESSEHITWECRIIMMGWEMVESFVEVKLDKVIIFVEGPGCVTDGTPNWATSL